MGGGRDSVKAMLLEQRAQEKRVSALEGIHVRARRGDANDICHGGHRDIMNNVGNVALGSIAVKLLCDCSVICPAIGIAVALEKSIVASSVEQEQRNHAQGGIKRREDAVGEVRVRQRYRHISGAGVVVKDDDRGIAHF
jgi:hypothetical protein